MEIAQPGGSGELEIGITTILGGTNGLFLYDNNGVLGEIAGLTKSQADTYYYPLSTNPAGYLTSSSISGEYWHSISPITAPTMPTTEGATGDILTWDTGTQLIWDNNINLHSSLGSELAPSLTTPNWAFPSGWSYATSPDRLVETVGGNGNMTTASPLAITVGVTYKVTITVDSISSSNDTEWSLGGSAGTGFTTAGTFVTYVTATSTDSIIFYSQSSGDQMVISQISIVPITSGGTLTVDGTTTFNSPIIVNNSISFGNKPTILGSMNIDPNLTDIVFGNNNNVGYSPYGNLIIGNSNTMTSLFGGTVIIGSGISGNEDAVIIGFGASQNGEGVAIGNSAFADSGGVGIGAFAYAGVGGVAINSNDGSEFGVQLLGSSAGIGDISLGYQSYTISASGGYAIAIGWEATTGDTQDIAIGYNAFTNTSTPDGGQSIALGSGTQANNFSSIALGTGAIAGAGGGAGTGDNSIAIGNGAATTLDNQIVLGGTGYRMLLGGATDDTTSALQVNGTTSTTSLTVKGKINVANLPSGATQPGGLSTGDLWINTTTHIIQVAP